MRLQLPTITVVAEDGLNTFNLRQNPQEFFNISERKTVGSTKWKKLLCCSTLDFILEIKLFMAVYVKAEPVCCLLTERLNSSSSFKSKPAALSYNFGYFPCIHLHFPFITKKNLFPICISISCFQRTHFYPLPNRLFPNKLFICPDITWNCQFS